MKVKVAIICGMPPNREGEANYSYEVYSRLLDHYADDFQFRFFSHVTDRPELLDGQKWDITRVTGGIGRQKLLSVYRLYNAIVAYQPALAHFQGVHTSLYGMATGEPMILLFWLLRRKGIKVIHTVHSTWLKCHLEELFQAKGANYLKRTLALAYFKTVTRLMNEVPDSVRILVAGQESVMQERFVRFYRIRNKAITQEWHPCSQPNLNIDKILHIREQLGWTKDYVFLATGFVRRDKGYHNLVAAFAQLLEIRPNIRLLIGGSPQGADGILYAEELSMLVNQLQLAGKVELQMRFLATEEYNDFFAGANAVVVPYTRAIGASGPIHQALSAGKTVIATAVDHNLGLRSVVNLYDGSRNDSLFAAMQKATDDGSIVNSTSVSYADKHNWEQMASIYVSAYQKMLS